MSCLHPIIYIAHIGERHQSALPIIPNEHLLSHLLMEFLGSMPKSLEHFAYGYSYYRSIMSSVAIDGFLLLFQYDDSLNLPLPFTKYPDGNDSVVIHLICDSNENSIKLLHKALLTSHTANTAYVVDSEDEAELLELPNVMILKQKVYDFLYNITVEILGVEEGMFSVPIDAKKNDLGFTFVATRPNTFLCQSIMGNWGYPFINITNDQLVKDGDVAIAEFHTFNRQRLILRQIARIDDMEHEAFTIKGSLNQMRDELYAPLIISAPFISHDLKAYLTPDGTMDKDLLKGMWKALKRGQSHNYVNFVIQDEHLKESSRNLMAQISTTQEVLKSICLYLDMVTQLHASFRNSPCLRLPVIGEAINKELSYVSPRINERLVSGKKRDSVGKVMMDIGQIIADHCLSKEALQMFKRLDRQIVVISDLPVEWTMIDGIPLSFTHDVCRLPFTHINSALMHYATNSLVPMRYVIPTDILHRTLVAYGCSDGHFALSQEQCEDMKNDLGFNTAHCNTVDAFVHAINQYEPELLVVDTHGGTDLQRHQSYIMMGDERLLPSDISKLKKCPRLVFMSACNTAPTYNLTNTIANAFFGVGAQSVVSSYMPLEVYEASTLYLRLLRQLSLAQEMPMFRNWLGFISDLFRSSYLFSAYKDLMIKRELKEFDERAELVQTRANLTLFDERRKIYYTLREGKTLDGVKVSTKNVVPQ